jgi:hypothetical protein
MGFMFILFSDLRNEEIYMIAFLLFFGLSAGAQMFAKRKGWHRKYLDYRTLAEGLRVQFYLSAAGITGDDESKFTHDNFLQTQDPELGWIRNVMRVAGTRCDSDRHVSQEGLEFTLKEWIGDNESGQLGYYRRKAAQWVIRNRNTERLSTLSLATSVAVILLILFGGAFGETYIDPLFVIMGSMLLAYGVRHGYAQSTAEKELIKQYEFMLRVFHNSRFLARSGAPVSMNTPSGSSCTVIAPSTEVKSGASAGSYRTTDTRIFRSGIRLLREANRRRSWTATRPPRPRVSLVPSRPDR